MSGNRKLTPFEWSMLIQSESDPMTFAIRLVFEGSVCSRSLRASVAEAAISHPLLTSCVRSEGGVLSIFQAPPNELIWVPSDLVPEINELSTDDSGRLLGLDPFSDRIDLSRENGVKTFVSEYQGKTDVHFLFHHAACDGLGGFKFVEEVLARYHRARTQTRTPIPVSDPELLKLRNPRCETSLPWYRRMARAGFVVPRRILGMTRRPPAKIATRAPDPVVTTDQPASSVLQMPTITLSEEQTVAVSRSAKERHSTTNEMLLNRLFIVLSEWNQKFETVEPGKLRVIVPFSLRTEAHQAMPAANCVSMVYVDAGSSGAEAGSLARISKQLKYIRDWQIEYSWNQTASFAFRSRRIAALLREQSSRRLYTTVLSNLGRPFKHFKLPAQEDGKITVGGLVLKSAHVAAPTTANSTATFAALFYANRLTLTMNYSIAKMSRKDAQDLLELWGRSLVYLD